LMQAAVMPRPAQHGLMTLAFASQIPTVVVFATDGTTLPL
jgi:hypothetical protein